MKALQILSLLLILCIGLNACAVQPRNRVVVVKKSRPAKVVVVKPAHRRNHVVVLRR